MLVLIAIIRVRCIFCRHTHAIMPCFSVPWTSLDSAELETWFSRRATGKSRLQAAEGLSAALDWYRTGLRVERSLDRLMPVIKAVLQAMVDHRMERYTALKAMAGTDGNVIAGINRRCLAASSVPLCFARIGDLVFARRNAGSRISHDLVSTNPGRRSPDSS